jgi:chromosome segregation ATPase
MSDKIMEEALRAYKDNYVQYKMTGNQAYKVAYENAEAWMKTYIAQKEKETEEQSRTINGFVQKYTDTNPEIARLGTEMKTIRKEGPRLQDRYATEQKINADSAEQLDLTPYYVKTGVAVGILGVLITLSLL